MFSVLSPLPPSLPPFFTLAELDAEHGQKVMEMEHVQQAKLKERQKYFEEAFQQDMEQYLSTGYLQITERRGETRAPRYALPAPSQTLTLSRCCSVSLLQIVKDGDPCADTV